MAKGYRIVLTASRSEMSQFGPERGAPADVDVDVLSAPPTWSVKTPFLSKK